EGVDAAAIEEFDPEAEHAGGAAKLQAEGQTGQAQEQGANGIEADVRPQIGGRFHRHLEFLKGGVLRVGFNLWGRHAPVQPYPPVKYKENFARWPNRKFI